MPRSNPVHAFTTKGRDIKRVLQNQFQVKPADEIKATYPDKLPVETAIGIWDTGATNTAISKKLAKALKLKPIDKVPVSGVHSSTLANVFLVDILLPNRVAVGPVRVTEAANLLNCDILIGMDIIATGDFSVTNADGQTWWSFRLPPSMKHIDYVEDVERIKNNEAKKTKGGSTRKTSRRKH